MQQDNHHQASKDHADHSNAQGEQEQLPTVKTKPRKIKALIYEALFFLFFGVAGIVFFVNHAFAILSIVLLLIGLISAAFWIRLELINYGAKHALANRWWWAVAIPSVMLCIIIFCVKWPESKEGHVKLLFGLATSETNALWLTNDIFFSPLPAQKSSWYIESILSTNMPWVVIPLPATETNLVLLPLLLNDSEFDAESVNLQIFIRGRVKTLTGNSWDLYTEKNGIELAWKGHSILKGRSTAMGAITFPEGLPITNPSWKALEDNAGLRIATVAIVTEAKGTPATRLLFWLVQAPLGTNESVKISAFAASDVLRYSANGSIMLTIPKIPERFGQ